MVLGVTARVAVEVIGVCRMSVVFPASGWPLALMAIDAKPQRTQRPRVIPEIPKTTALRCRFSAHPRKPVWGVTGPGRWDTVGWSSFIMIVLSIVTSFVSSKDSVVIPQKPKTKSVAMKLRSYSAGFCIGFRGDIPL